MPCTDITETLRLVCDENDCLVDYHLAKRTCGAPIGQTSLLLPWLQSMPVSGVLALEPEDLTTHVDMAEEEEFLYFKHFFALQEGLKAFTGSSAENNLCIPVSVCVEDNTTVFECDVPVQGITQRIKSCGHCGSCNRKKTGSSAPQ